MGPHADPLFVGLLQAIVYEDNACQSRPDYGARIVRVVNDRQIKTSVKEQAKIAFVRFIQSLYSIEECASPPFLHPYEMEDDDEASTAGALPTGADGDDEDQGEGLETSPSSAASTGGTPGTPGVHGANQTHSRPSALRRMQNCELVRRLFNKSLDMRKEEEEKDQKGHNNPTKNKGEGEEEGHGGDDDDDDTGTTKDQESNPQPSSSSGDQLGEEGEANSEVIEKSSESAGDVEKEGERYFTPVQKKERKEFVRYLNAFVTSQATLTAAVGKADGRQMGESSTYRHRKSDDENRRLIYPCVQYVWLIMYVCRCVCMCVYICMYGTFLQNSSMFANHQVKKDCTDHRFLSFHPPPSFPYVYV